MRTYNVSIETNNDSLSIGTFQTRKAAIEFARNAHYFRSGDYKKNENPRVVVYSNSNEVLNIKLKGVKA